MKALDVEMLRPPGGGFALARQGPRFAAYNLKVETRRYRMTLVYEGGVFKPKGSVPAAVKEHAVVHVVIVEDAVADVAPNGDDDSTGWETAMELRGCIEGGPSDVARNHDKYLYDNLRPR